MSGRRFDGRDDRGSALVEMAILGSLVFALLVQMIVLFGAVQQTALAATAAARDAGRAIALADDDRDGAVRADRAVREAASNHGLAVDALHVDAEGAVVRNGIVDVEVRSDVPLLRLPGLGRIWPSLAIPVSARYRAHVDRFRSFDATR